LGAEAEDLLVEDIVLLLLGVLHICVSIGLLVLGVLVVFTVLFVVPVAAGASAGRLHAGHCGGLGRC